MVWMQQRRTPQTRSTDVQGPFESLDDFPLGSGRRRNRNEMSHPTFPYSGTQTPSDDCRSNCPRCRRDAKQARAASRFVFFFLDQAFHLRRRCVLARSVSRQLREGARHPAGIGRKNRFANRRFTGAAVMRIGEKGKRKAPIGPQWNGVFVGKGMCCYDQRPPASRIKIGPSIGLPGVVSTRGIRPDPRKRG